MFTFGLHLHMLFTFSTLMEILLKLIYFLQSTSQMATGEELFFMINEYVLLNILRLKYCISICTDIFTSMTV